MSLSTHSSGFTLIEILLVLTILGLLSGLALLTAPHNPARMLESEVRGFQSLLEQTRDVAIRNSEHYGVTLGPGGWQVLQLSNRDTGRGRWARVSWADLNIDHPRHDWSEAVQAELAQTKTKLRRTAGKQGIGQPDLIAYANGEMSSFLVRVSSRQDRALRYQLQSDGLNIKVSGG